MTRPLRIAMVAFVPNHHTTRWSRALAAAGFDVHLVYDSSPDGCPELPPGVTAHAVTRVDSVVPVWTASAAWHRALREVQPDLVYMQWLFARPAMLVALDPAWPLVVTVMGSDVRQDASRPESTLERIWRTALLLRARCITVPAMPLARVVAAYHRDLADRIEIVPFGVDTSQFRPPETPRQRKADAPLVIGHFKSDDPIYGRIDLLRAVEPLARAGRVQLRLAGWRGNDGGAVTDYLAMHPALQAVTQDHGRLDVDEMARLYRDLDVYVLNSQQESFGVAAAEALASGVPVVATDVGGVASLVRTGDTGLLVPPGDVDALREALVELAVHPALARSMGARGRQRVCARFEWQGCVDRMAALLREAVAGGPAQAATARSG